MKLIEWVSKLIQHLYLNVSLALELDRGIARKGWGYSSVRDIEELLQEIEILSVKPFPTLCTFCVALTEF